MSQPRSQSISFDRAAAYYDATRSMPAGTEPGMVEAFVQAGALGSHTRVLEIGVGTGRIALPVARRVGQYVGIDLSPAMLARLLSKRRDERVLVTVGDATRVPFARDTFDVAIAVHIFHLLPYQAALDELTRVVVPGGLLLHAYGSRIAAPDVEQIWRMSIGKNPDEPTSAQPLPPGASEQFIEQAGWAPAGDPAQFRYTDARAPQQYYDTLANRMWSHTWSMPDDEFNARLERLRAFIAEHYADPTIPLPYESAFIVQAYRSPRG